MMNYKGYLVFLFASLAVSIGLQLVLPFPYGLGAALAIFIIFPLLYPQTGVHIGGQVNEKNSKFKAEWAKFFS